MIEILLAQRLIAPHGSVQPAALVMEDGVIVAAGNRADVALPPSARVHDFGPAVLAPGYIDLHVHGGGGFDFMSAEGPGLAAIAQHLARHGVTHFLATTVTAPWESMRGTLQRLSRAGLDIHLEGPFLSPQQCGVHPPADLLLPTLPRLDHLWQSSEGRLRWITLAPELDGALEFIAAATALGIGISLGHSAASLAQARAGIAAGARHVTHTFNAMPPLHHRAPGLLGEALANPHLDAEIIADGLHVDPLLVAMFLRLKGAARAILVSDGISAAGCGDGVFRLGSIPVTVAGERCTWEGRLAGSVLTLDRAVRNTMQFAGWDLPAAVGLASANPARLLGLPDRGRLQPGARADVVVLSPGGEVIATFLAGRKLH